MDELVVQGILKPGKTGCVEDTPDPAGEKQFLRPEHSTIVN